MDEQPRRRIPVAVLVTPIVVLSVAGMVGDAMGPRLINTHPLVQMFLNPRNRWLVLATANVSIVPFFIVGFTRLVLTDPIGYVLGRQHGEAALQWAEDKLGEEGGMIRRVERWFRRAAPLVILVMPNLYMCILAGATGMRAGVFFTLNVIGTLGRLTLIWMAGEAFESELESVLGVIRDYQWWLVGLSFVVVALQARKRKQQGVLESPQDIEDEIEALEDESHP